MPSSHPIKPYSVSKRDHNTEIGRFLADSMGISMRKAKALLDHRAVWVNNKRVWMAKHRLSAGDRVEVRDSSPTPSRSPEKPMKSLFEDSSLVAVNKPAGMVSESHKQSVEALLRLQREDPGLRALHRLDKETSGVLLFTKGSVSREPYIQMFRDLAVQKRYAALLAGTMGNHPVEVRQRLDGKEAHSIFTELKRNRGKCLAECEILTGRTHQIRRHALHAGCRVLGDSRYKGGPEMTPEEKAIPRQMLHAEGISFQCPHTGAHLDIQAPWPEDFASTANALGLSR